MAKFSSVCKATTIRLLKEAFFLTQGEITPVLPPTGQNIALEFDVTADISLFDPICTQHKSLAAVSLSLERKVKNCRF